MVTFSEKSDQGCMAPDFLCHDLGDFVTNPCIRPVKLGVNPLRL